MHACIYRNMPIAVMFAVLAATFLYVMTNVSYFTVLSPEELLASDTVAIVSISSSN